jgi:hypothetical protein
METEFKNANALAHAIEGVAGITLTPRPYNRFEPDNTVWWLVPSTEWPAYKYGKLFFDSRKDHLPQEQDGIYCGFYIEKGLSPAVSNFYPPSLIMDDAWLWNDFIKTIPAGLPQFLTELILTISANYIPPEKADYLDSPEGFFEQKENFEASRASFLISPKFQLKLISQKPNPVNREISEYVKNSVCKAKNIVELVPQLVGFPQSDWIWLDFYIGPIVGKGLQRMGPAYLWKQYLEPWLPWLR